MNSRKSLRISRCEVFARDKPNADTRAYARQARRGSLSHLHVFQKDIIDQMINKDSERFFLSFPDGLPSWYPRPETSRFSLAGPAAAAQELESRLNGLSGGSMTR